MQDASSEKIEPWAFYGRIEKLERDVHEFAANESGVIRRKRA